MLVHQEFDMLDFHSARFWTWRVLELGMTNGADQPGSGHLSIDAEHIEQTLQKMAIVIPICNERIPLLRGVMTGIPRGVDIIVVSGSSRSPVDRFRAEAKTLELMGEILDRSFLHVHQRDPTLGEALERGGYSGLLGPEGRVDRGKGQGMSLGILLALARGASYIGFIDADNFVPGAVHEHVCNYAAGFATFPSDHVCVREIWPSKPQFRDGLVFRKRGRCSRRTNRFLNDLVGAHTGFETDLIETGNAGEHAIDAALAEHMPLAAGYAVETWEIMWMLERWGRLDMPSLDGSGVDILQVEAVNPHFHEPGDDGHIRGMVADSLGVIYHSALATPRLKEKIEVELARCGYEGPPPEPQVLPAPCDGDKTCVLDWLQESQAPTRQAKRKVLVT